MKNSGLGMRKDTIIFLVVASLMLTSATAVEAFAGGGTSQCPAIGEAAYARADAALQLGAEDEARNRTSINERAEAQKWIAIGDMVKDIHNAGGNCAGIQLDDWVPNGQWRDADRAEACRVLAEYAWAKAITVLATYAEGGSGQTKDQALEEAGSWDEHYWELRQAWLDGDTTGCAWSPIAELAGAESG